MGKAQKLKAERKRARVQAEINKKKTIKNSFKYGTLALVLIGLGIGGFFGYMWLDGKYNINDRLGGILRQAQDDSSGQESEEMVERKTYTKVPGMQINFSKEYIANFETNQGNFSIKLFAGDAPNTVNNFVVLSRDKFYDGLTFHRIIKDFMIQGGDPEGTGSGGPGYQFEDEFNDHKLVKGTLAMANSGPNTNGSQFFIVTAESTEWLDGKHTAFGEVVEGLDVVMAIQSLETDDSDKPTEPVVINTISISEK